ncbi:ABC transporter ATP-binding protein/permease [Candidatus Thioglobus sp.]|nr:ABC transporter ATP-binding protein/permease [Candidatus Thioglobus sp.]
MPNPPLLNLLRRLLRHIVTRRRMQFGLLFIVMILASFAEVVSIGAILPFLTALTSPEKLFVHPFAQPIIKILNLTEPKQLLFPLSIFFGISALLSGFMRLTLVWAQTRLTYAVGADLSFSIYRRTLYQPYAVHVERNSSEVIAGISNKANVVVDSIILPLAVIVSSVLMLLSILLALLAIEPVVAISAFGGFGAIYIIVILTTKKALARDSERINYETGRLLKALQEGLGGIRDVLIDGTQAIYCMIYRNADIPLRRASANIAIISSIPRYGIEALGMILITILAYSLANGEGGITNAIPVLGALALGAQRLLPVLQQGYSSWTMIRGGQAILSGALDLLDQPLPPYLNEPSLPLMPFQRDISLRNLTFQYAKDAPWVFEHELNLTISKGSSIGFIGSTGAGKSTLLDIIMGLLEPVSGSLAIDGININEQNHRGWQTHIAHVPQTIFLADTSIAENIAFGIPVEKIDFTLLKQVAHRAQISQTIESWKKQYNTVVGERGVRLSGGQRQRIGIARALYKKADVIVLDEATSSLDNDTESTVMKAIENLGVDITLIIVAHRLTTLKNCTEIVELENGRIKRKGSYESIVENFN